MPTNGSGLLGRVAAMTWFLDGLGTMLLGLLLGGGAGGIVGHKIGVNSVRQKQAGGRNSRQSQVGRDYNASGPDKDT